MKKQLLIAAAIAAMVVAVCSEIDQKSGKPTAAVASPTTIVPQRMSAEQARALAKATFDASQHIVDIASTSNAAALSDAQFATLKMLTSWTTAMSHAENRIALAPFGQCEVLATSIHAFLKTQDRSLIEGVLKSFNGCGVSLGELRK
jgi:hypothetical protein